MAKKSKKSKYAQTNKYKKLASSNKTIKKSSTSKTKKKDTKSSAKKLTAQKSIARTKKATQSNKTTTRKSLTKKATQSNKTATRKSLTKKAAKPHKTADKKITLEKKSTQKNIKNITSASKFSKADAARSIKKKAVNKKSSDHIPSQSTAHSSAISSSSKKEINVEQALQETKEESFLPPLGKSTEKISFSENLSNDLSSVYAQTLEEIPEPQGKYILEFPCQTSPKLLYKFLVEPMELSEWFCDSVHVRNGIYTFVWNGIPQQARLVKQERDTLVRFQWVDKNDGSYFEFQINKSALTGGVTLSIIDFSSPEELESNKLWWNTQIKKLKTILGLQY